MGLLGEIEQFPGGSQLQSLRSSPSQGASRMGMGAGQSFRPLNHFGPCNEPVTVIWVAPQDVKSYDWTYFRSHFASRNHKSLEVWKRKSKKPAVCFFFWIPRTSVRCFRNSAYCQHLEHPRIVFLRLRYVSFFLSLTWFLRWFHLQISRSQERLSGKLWFFLDTLVFSSCSRM